MDPSQKLYTPATYLSDYMNVLAGIRLLTNPVVPLDAGILKAELKEHPMPLVEERYAHQGRGNGNWRDILAHPEKVQRINQIVQLVNADSDNVTLFKRAANEICRLLNGKGCKLPYDEPNHNPDLLEVPPLDWVDYYILAVNNLHLMFPTEDDPEIPTNRKRITHGFEFMSGTTDTPKDDSHMTPAERHHAMAGGSGEPPVEPMYGFSKLHWRQTYRQFFAELDGALARSGFTAADTIRVSEPRGLEKQAWYQERWRVFYPIFLAMIAKGYKRPELLM